MVLAASYLEWSCQHCAHVSTRTSASGTPPRWQRSGCKCCSGPRSPPSSPPGWNNKVVIKSVVKTKTNKHTRFQVDRPLFQNSNISCPYKSNYFFEQEGGKRRLEVQTYLVGTRNLLQKEIILPILEKASLKTFETKVMQYIVTYFWERLWKKYLLHAIIYLCLIATFSFGHWLVINCPDCHPSVNTSVCPAVIN